MNIIQFRAAVAVDAMKATKLCGYEGCTKPLGPRHGEHNKVGGKPVCEDCYFDSFDDATPIGVPGIRRR